VQILFPRNVRARNAAFRGSTSRYVPQNSGSRLDVMAFEETPAERREVTVRRAPKYVPFLILGAVVGIVAAAVVAYAVPGDASFDPGSVFGFFLIMFAAIGAILGAGLALVLDRRSVKRQQRAVVEAVPDSEPDTDPQG
jgi:hypothetical protein